MKAGTCLQSTSLLEGDFFEDTVILITECNEEGATGFVVNRLFPRRFNELEEFKHSKAFNLYEGGPVDQGHLFFIHRRPDLISGGTLITGAIYQGGDFKEAVNLINNQTLTPADIKLFVGYCGWDSRELDAEIEEGSWQVCGDEDLFGVAE